MVAFAGTTLRERVVWNDSLACSQEKYKSGSNKPTNSQLQKQFITQAKKTEYREWLSEVSNIPLQQSLNDLNQAYQNFFKSTKGQRKGKPVKPPKFMHQEIKTNCKIYKRRV
uniref:hypothetical protein n=1 Tax=Okeania sp. SIO2F4 TaxID=2607790 RepID=UPI0025E5E129|nr:hypothetical protein [Okeania sp. SIO2F4]